jgi:hypothetical protein
MTKKEYWYIINLESFMVKAHSESEAKKMALELIEAKAKIDSITRDEPA